MNYNVHDKELLAIVESFKIWKVYLEGAKHEVQVFTDYKNLMSFTSTKVLNRRQVRWSEELSSYNFRIQYRKGSENGRADALSRRSDYFQDGKELSQKAVLMVDNEGHIRYNRQDRTLAATYIVDNRDLTIQLREITSRDEFAQEILEGLEKNQSHEGFNTEDGFLRFQGRIYIPAKLRQEFLNMAHSAPTSGHFGQAKTLKHLRGKYYFPGIRKKVIDLLRNSRHVEGL